MADSHADDRPNGDDHTDASKTISTSSSLQEITGTASATSHLPHSTSLSSGQLLGGSSNDPFFIALQNGVLYEFYRGEQQLEEISSLIERDLSEPYSVYTYRYFLNQWPELCFLVSILKATHFRSNSSFSHLEFPFLSHIASGKRPIGKRNHWPSHLTLGTAPLSYAGLPSNAVRLSTTQTQEDCIDACGFHHCRTTSKRRR